MSGALPSPAAAGETGPRLTRLHVTSNARCTHARRGVARSLQNSAPRSTGRGSNQSVVNDRLGVLIGIGPVVGALLWRGRQDRLRRRANHVRADISAAANRVLGGESVLSVHVEPRVAWRTGRVHLSAPGGYEFLIASVSGAVIARLPTHYELVVGRA